MSSLIFHTDLYQAYIATDTLAVDLQGDPFLFTTKTFALPHLKLLIAGTGAGGFCGRWFLQANDFMLARDVDHLNYHATSGLRTIWSRFKKEFSVDSDFTTTVYHFGISSDQTIKTYAYRSINDFISEEIGYGIGVKPPCEVPKDYKLPDQLLDLMLEQKRIQSKKEKDERVHIGGQIQVHHLTTNGITIHTQTNFPDYKEVESRMYSTFNQK